MIDSRQPTAQTGADEHDLKRCLVLGSVSGLVIFVATWGVVLLLSFFPSLGIQLALGGRYYVNEPATTGVKVIRSLLAGWGGQGYWRRGGTPTDHASFSGMMLADLLVAVAVVVIVGFVVRRVVSRSLRARLAALLAAAVVAAAVSAMAAAASRYTIKFRYPDRPFYHSYSPLSYLISTLLIVGLTGVFSFGAVALLPRRYARPLRHAAALVGCLTLVVGVLFPLLVVAHHVDGADASVDYGLDSYYAAGIGASSLPAAFGGELALGNEYISMFSAYGVWTGPPKEHWSSLARYVTAHPMGHVWRYVRAFGTMGKALAIISLIVVIGLVAFAAALASRRSKRVFARSGLLEGGLLAAATAVFLVPAVLLCRYEDHATYVYGSPFPYHLHVLIGVTNWGLLEGVIAMSVLSCGAGTLAAVWWNKSQQRVKDSKPSVSFD